MQAPKLATPLRRPRKRHTKNEEEFSPDHYPLYIGTSDLQPLGVKAQPNQRRPQTYRWMGYQGPRTW